MAAGLRAALAARRHARARPDPGAAALSLVAALLGWLGVLILALLVALLTLIVFVVAPGLA